MKLDLEYSLHILNHYGIQVRIKGYKIYALEWYTVLNKYGQDTLHESWRRIDNMTQGQFDNWIANM